MTTHTLMEYLQQFPPESIPAIVVVNRNRGLKYPIQDTIGVMGEGRPLIVLDVGEAVDWDVEDEDEQDD